MTMPYADAWNTWFDDTGNAPSGVAALRDIVDEACRDVGRDPATVRRTVAVLVRLPGRHRPHPGERGTAAVRRPSKVRRPTWPTRSARYAAARASTHVQLVVDPITLDSIRALAPVLTELDRG